MADQSTTKCPCGSGNALSDCCLPIIEGEPAPTAEALMRSRYTAYVREDEGYLLSSWHPRTRPKRIEMVQQQKWLGLKIRHTEQGRPDDAEGIVEFVARFKIAGKGHRLHEISRFERTPDGWKYVDGEIVEKDHARTNR